MKTKAALFDFDGVLADTEPMYNIFWAGMAKEHHITDPNFTQKVKGTTLKGIIETFFNDRSEEEQQQVIRQSESYDVHMQFPPMPGSIEFVHLLKEHHVPLALVTSSGDAKLEQAFKQLHLDGLFDTIVSVDRITIGKPHPMCYQLAAQDLHLSPNECLVFEDSFAGIEAGTRAGMRVIALSTTNPADQLEGKAYRVYPNLQGLTFAEYEDMCK